MSIDSGAPLVDLRPLALDDSVRGPDEMDDLLVVGLLASWPHAMGAVEVFAVLDAPKRSGLFGGYRRFIDEFAKGPQPEDVSVAISWLEAHLEEIESRSLEELADAIVVLAANAWSSAISPENVSVLRR